MVRTVIAIAGLSGLAVLAAWLLTPSSTDHDLLRAGPTRRAGRWSRSQSLRALLWWASWPHIIEKLGGVNRAPVEPTRYDTVWRDGSASLRRYASARSRGQPLLVVHALVTQPWILDLAPERSLVGALVASGFDVFLLDWGDADRGNATRSFAEYIAVLCRAEQRVLEESETDRLHLIGYCSGATLCLARLGGWDHPHVTSLAAIAPPVDLAVPCGMRRMLAHPWLKPVWALDSDGCVPAALIRESFHALRPEALRTVRRAFRRRRDPSFRATYDPLARWAYEQRRIPGALFFDTVEMYRTNALYQGRLTIDGHSIALDRVQVPILLAIAKHDHIVPKDSSLALTSVVQAQIAEVPSGHVSMLSGEGGRQFLWPALADFLDPTDISASTTQRRPAHARHRQTDASRDGRDGRRPRTPRQ